MRDAERYAPRPLASPAFHERPWARWDLVVVLYGFVFFIMASLGFAHSGIHRVAMLSRWPMLGAAASVGLILAMRQWAPLTMAARLLFLLLLTALVSSSYSSDPSYSFQRTVSLCLLWLATMVGIGAHARTWPALTRWTDVLWCLGALIAVGGFVFRGGDVGGEGRFEGLYDRATGAGTYGALFLPIALYQARYRFGGALKVIGYLVAAFLFLQILLAGARTALLISGVACLALVFEYLGRKAFLGLAAAMVLAPLPVVLSREMADSLRARSEKIVRVKSISTFTGRLDRWRFGLEQFCRRPIAGHGLGISRTLAGKEDPQRFRLTPGDVFNLHSDQIEVLVDLGMVGGLFFILFWIVSLGALGRLSTGPASRARQLGLAYGAGVFYAFVDTFMHGGFLAAGGGVSTFTWSFVALLFCCRRVDVAEAVRRRPRTTWDHADRDQDADLVAERHAAPSRDERRRRLRERLPSSSHVAGVL